VYKVTPNTPVATGLKDITNRDIHSAIHLHPYGRIISYYVLKVDRDYPAGLITKFRINIHVPIYFTPCFIAGWLKLITITCSLIGIVDPHSSSYGISILSLDYCKFSLTPATHWIRPTMFIQEYIYVPVLILRVIWLLSYRGRDKDYPCYIVECNSYTCSYVSYIYIISNTHSYKSGKRWYFVGIRPHIQSDTHKKNKITTLL